MPPKTQRFGSEIVGGSVLALALASTARAEPPAVVQNPSFDPHPVAKVIEVRKSRPITSAPTSSVRFSDLDDHRREIDDTWQDDVGAPNLPEGLVQVGGMVVPREVAEGAMMVADPSRTLQADGPTQHGLADEVCTYPDAVPAGIYDYDYRPGQELPRFHTVYVNFTGATLYTGGENAAENLSGIARSGHPFPAYSGGEANAIAVAQAIQNDFSDWAIRVVYLERPKKVLPYSMVMVGGHWSDTTSGPSGGVAPLDCEDFGMRNVCYAFQSFGVTGQANVASQEIGHTMGLHHTSASDSVMALGYAQTQSGDLGFNDSCASTIAVAGQGPGCAGVNKCHCGDGEHQHDKRTLSVIFSPAGVDTTPPTIAFVTPEDGQWFLPGDTVMVRFDPWDDVGGYGWKLMVEDEAGELLVDEVDYQHALEFPLTFPEEGTYKLIALIMDHADHETTAEITIHIGEPEAEDDSGSGDGGSGSDDGPPDPPDDTGTASDPIDATTTDDPNATPVDPSGCECTSSPRRPSSLALIGLTLLGLGRSRRRRPAPAA